MFFFFSFSYCRRCRFGLMLNHHCPGSLTRPVNTTVSDDKKRVNQALPQNRNSIPDPMISSNLADINKHGGKDSPAKRNVLSSESFVPIFRRDGKKGDART